MRRLFWAFMEEASFIWFQFAAMLEFAATKTDRRSRRLRCGILRRSWQLKGIPDQGGCYCGQHPAPWPS